MIKIYYYLIFIISIIFIFFIIFVSINFGIVGIDTYKNCTRIGTQYICFPEGYKPTLLDLLYIIITILFTILTGIIINKIFIYYKKR